MSRLKFILNKIVNKSPVCAKTTNNLFNWVKFGDFFNFFIGKKNLIIEVQVIGIDIKNQRLFVIPTQHHSAFSSFMGGNQIIMIMQDEFKYLDYKMSWEPAPILPQDMEDTFFDEFEQEIDISHDDSEYDSREHGNNEEWSV